jgi:hypothetical protein
MRAREYRLAVSWESALRRQGAAWTLRFRVSTASTLQGTSREDFTGSDRRSQLPNLAVTAPNVRNDRVGAVAPRSRRTVAEEEKKIECADQF